MCSLLLLLLLLVSFSLASHAGFHRPSPSLSLSCSFAVFQNNARPSFSLALFFHTYGRCFLSFLLLLKRHIISIYMLLLFSRHCLPLSLSLSSNMWQKCLFLFQLYNKHYYYYYYYYYYYLNEEKFLYIAQCMCTHYSMNDKTLRQRGIHIIHISH